jgi:methionyl-tRNA formyltransferase
VRVVFMGTPSFAVPALEALSARHDVVLVVTRPDRVAGRGRAPQAPEVKVASQRLGIPVLQPDGLRGDEVERIREARPDVVCVVAFGLIVPPEVLAIPAHGCVNVHASLLPKYRGAAPIQRAILAGDRVTGVSIMRMEQGLDTGPFALQREVTIADRYADDVEAELSQAGAEALLEVLDQLEAGIAHWTEQDDAAATYAAKITKDDVALLPELDVEQAFARVRAATRRAPARACVGDRELTVVRARPSTHTLAAGAVCLVEGVPHLGFREGALTLDVVRPSGKSDMAGPEWARGARLSADACWRCTR